MVPGKRAFVVCGPEGSGTRQVTRCLLAAGCFGDDGHQQRLDSMQFKGRRGQIVLRRSVPHGGQWPGLGKIALEMERAGYEVTALVCVREPVALARSQVAAGHAGSVALARQRIERAYRHIWGQWMPRRTARLVVVPFEAFVLHPRAMQAMLEGLLGLRVVWPDFPPWYDANVQHYVSPELLAMGIPKATAEVLAEAGFWTPEDLAGATDEALLKVPGIGAGRLAAIRAAVGGGEQDDER